MMGLPVAQLQNSGSGTCIVLQFFFFTQPLKVFESSHNFAFLPRLKTHIFVVATKDLCTIWTPYSTINPSRNI